MLIDTDKLFYYLNTQMEYYRNTGKYKVLDIWEQIDDEEHEYGDAEEVPRLFLQGYRDGIVAGMRIVKEAIEEAEEIGWSILR